MKWIDNFGLFIMPMIMLILFCVSFGTYFVMEINSINEVELCEEEYVGCEVYKCKSNATMSIFQASLNEERYTNCLLEIMIMED